MSQSVSSRAATSQTAPSQAASRPGQPASARDTSVIAVTLNESERAVLEALREIRYGEVEVVVHGSRIVQITRSQKLRVDGR
jgi:hypothetical protein